MRALPLETPSLRLRQFVPQDAPAMMALNSEPTTRRWLPSHVYSSIDEAVARIEHLISSYSTPGHPQRGPYVLAVEHKAEGRLLGHVGFSPYRDEVEVSYAISEASRGRGYGAEALICACTWVADEFALRRVLAITESANFGSRRLLDRASFVHDREVLMLFQGSEQWVSHYHWCPQGKPGDA